MHERMKYITELARHATYMRIITPTVLLDKLEKQEALDYLKKDMDIDVEVSPISEDESLIEIRVK